MKKSNYEISGEQARPWLRYWARMVDMYVFMIILMLVFIPLFRIFGIDSEFLDFFPEIIVDIIILFLFIFIEALFLSTWGTTIGKALFKIRVRNIDGIKLSYTEALKRSFLVFYLGQGMGIPIFIIIVGIMSYNKLQKDGITSWDDGYYIVSHQILGKIRATLLIAFPLLMLVLIILGV